MLILTRREGQAIDLAWHGPPLLTGASLGEIKVLEIAEGQVRLGFFCPRDLAITRDNARVRQPPSNENKT